MHMSSFDLNKSQVSLASQENMSSLNWKETKPKFIKSQIFYFLFDYKSFCSEAEHLS